MSPSHLNFAKDQPLAQVGHGEACGQVVETPEPHGARPEISVCAGAVPEGSLYPPGGPELKVSRGARRGGAPRCHSSPRADCSCCSPSLDTKGSSCTKLPRVYVGGAWANQFRDAVADSLKEAWPRRSGALRDCGRAAVQFNCKCCLSPHLVPFRCGARTCPTCARLAAAVVSNRVAARVAEHDRAMETEPWDGPGHAQRRSWRLVTLTARADADVDSRFEAPALRRRVQRVRQAFPQFWRETNWGRQTRDQGASRKRARRDTSYICAVEVAPGGMVHIHALIFGEFISQKELVRAWSRALGERALVDVRAVSGRGGVRDTIREVLKYATKGESGVRTQAERAAAVELAFRNVKRVTLGGTIRRVKVVPDDDGTVDVSGRDLLNDHALSCEVCGVVGEWAWAGRRSPETVEANNGFGLLTWPGAVERERG